MKLMLTCKETHRLESERLDRHLSMLERVRLRMHLSVCDACTRFKGQLALLRQAMQHLTVPEDAGSEHETR